MVGPIKTITGRAGIDDRHLAGAQTRTARHQPLDSRPRLHDIQSVDGHIAEVRVLVGQGGPRLRRSRIAGRRIAGCLTARGWIAMSRRAARRDLLEPILPLKLFSPNLLKRRGEGRQGGGGCRKRRSRLRFRLVRRIGNPHRRLRRGGIGQIDDRRVSAGTGPEGGPETGRFRRGRQIVVVRIVVRPGMKNVRPAAWLQLR